MIGKLVPKGIAAALAGMALLPMSGFADTISPTSYTDTLGVGDSVTIRKTVVVEEAVSTGVIDVMFLFDTSGSMGPYIAAAKTAASDILAGLSAFGDLATGTGYYSEGAIPGFDGVFRDLTTDDATGIANINDIALGLGGGGGDFPELGFDGTKDAAENASWRPGSNRFVIALGDATFKESATATLASTQAALLAANATFIGIEFGTCPSFSMTCVASGGIDPTLLADATGGSIVPASTDPASIVAAIIDSVTGSFATYTEVAVSDLGAGLPGVGVSVACVSAAAGGSCAGDVASGVWTREESRTFEFDVTFTGLTEGIHGFPTRALVDGGIVATEDDRIIVTDVPEPATLLLLGAGLVGFAGMRRRAAA